MNKFALIFCTALLLAGCNSKNSSHSALCGTFEGTLPAADGPGIATTIQFNKNNTLQQKLVYIDQKNGTFNENGTFSVKGDIVEVKVGNNDTQYYKMGKNELRRLDSQKTVITGPLENYYILKQTKPCL